MVHLVKIVKNRGQRMNVDLLYNVELCKLVFAWWLITFNSRYFVIWLLQLVEKIFSSINVKFGTPTLVVFLGSSPWRVSLSRNELIGSATSRGENKTTCYVKQSAWRSKGADAAGDWRRDGGTASLATSRHSTWPVMCRKTVWSGGRG